MIKDKKGDNVGGTEALNADDFEWEEATKTVRAKGNADLSGYLQKTEATTKYLSKTQAGITYLKKADAYVPKILRRNLRIDTYTGQGTASGYTTLSNIRIQDLENICFMVEGWGQMQWTEPAGSGGGINAKSFRVKLQTDCQHFTVQAPTRTRLEASVITGFNITDNGTVITGSTNPQFWLATNDARFNSPTRDNCYIVTAVTTDPSDAKNCRVYAYVYLHKYTDRFTANGYVDISMVITHK